jgi:hypothetical protein
MVLLILLDRRLVNLNPIQVQLVSIFCHPVISGMAFLGLKKFISANSVAFKAWHVA